MAVGCAGAALVAAGCGLTNTSSKVETVTVTRTVVHTVTTTASAPAPPAAASACTAAQLSGTFAVEPGSAGAGNIVYKLTVTNASQQGCTVSGIPRAQLVDANGKQLETAGAQNGTGTAAQVTIQPGSSATAEARFSPDVDPCGTTSAATLRVTAPGGGTFDVKIDPATRVCNHGAMQWTPFTSAA
jgi:uncharacterized protein DUF4232